MSVVEIPGGSLYWVEQGSGDPVVFVHGIPTDYRAWSEQLASLSGTFRTVAYSRRYAYPNQRAGDVRDSTIENNALDLQALIETTDLGRVHLVGHSYGGFIAAYFASRHPELLRSLALIEPALAPLLLRDPNSRLQALSLLLRHPRVALSAARFLRRSQRPALQALDRGELGNAVRLNVAGVEDRVDAFDRFSAPVQQLLLDNGRTVKESDTPFPAFGREELERIRVPTLLLNGETSALWLRAIGATAARWIPNCEHAVIAGAGHYPHLQRPDEVSRRLVGFLGRVAG